MILLRSSLAFPLVALAAIADAHAASPVPCTAGQPCATTTTTLTERLVFNTPSVTTRTVDTYSTRILGRLAGGTVFDETLPVPFADPAAQAGLARAQATITARGGPGIVLAAPVRTQRTETITSASASVYALDRKTETIDLRDTLGPMTIEVGTLPGQPQQPGGCAAAIAALPSPARPACTADTRVSYAVVAGQSNLDISTTNTYFINEARSVTETRLIFEQWEVEGRVVAIGTIHAEVQSGLFELGSRLLGRLSRINAGSAVWGEVYGFEVEHGGRRRALGFAAGVAWQLGEGFTLSLGADHGRVEIDVPGATETATVDLTEFGAALRFDSGAVSATLAALYGAGDAETTRRIFGEASGRYDVQIAGVALDIGYAFDAGGWTLRPVAGLDFLSIHTDGFAEAGTLGLAAVAQDVERLRASAGLEIARDFGAASLVASARYVATLDGDDRALPVAFATTPTRLLDMTGIAEPDTVHLGTRLDIPVSDSAALGLTYDGRFADGYDAHTAALVLRIAL